MIYIEGNILYTISGQNALNWLSVFNGVIFKKRPLSFAELTKNRYDFYMNPCFYFLITGICRLTLQACRPEGQKLSCPSHLLPPKFRELAKGTDEISLAILSNPTSHLIFIQLYHGIRIVCSCSRNGTCSCKLAFVPS